MDGECYLPNRWPGPESMGRTWDSGYWIFEILLRRTHDHQQIILLEHACSLNCSWSATPWVRATLYEDTNDIIVPLEDGPGKRRLTLVIDSISIRSSFDKFLDKIGMAIVGCKHEEGIS